MGPGRALEPTILSLYHAAKPRTTYRYNVVGVRGNGISLNAGLIWPISSQRWLHLH